jgi:UDP-3-O-[3-hydroxymyristoyl] glucosamine N-acyltransferase
MKDLVIIGAGSFGEEMLDNINLINGEKPTWNVVGFTDETRVGEIDGVKILGKLDDFLKMDKSLRFFVASLDGKQRERITNICKAAGFAPATIYGVELEIDESAVIGEGAYIGHKSCIADGCTIGAGVILEYKAAIGNHTSIGDYTLCRIFMDSGKSVRIGKYNTFGLRCTVDDRVETADGCSFGVGAVLLENVEVPGKYIGVPAKLTEAVCGQEVSL